MTAETTTWTESLTDEQGRRFADGRAWTGSMPKVQRALVDPGSGYGRSDRCWLTHYSAVSHELQRVRRVAGEVHTTFGVNADELRMSSATAVLSVGWFMAGSLDREIAENESRCPSSGGAAPMRVG